MAEGLKVKVCDFGLSRVEIDNSGTLTQLRGTYQYAAPEVSGFHSLTYQCCCCGAVFHIASPPCQLDSRSTAYLNFLCQVYEGFPYTAKSDIYSLGVLIWEVFFRTLQVLSFPRSHWLFSLFSPYIFVVCMLRWSWFTALHCVWFYQRLLGLQQAN